jgi:transposase
MTGSRQRFRLAGLSDEDPAKLWKFYVQLVEIEAAFKNLKDDLQLRPIHHHLEHRIEAHIFVDFIAYCLRGVDFINFL